MQVTTASLSGVEAERFMALTLMKMREPPWSLNQTQTKSLSVSKPPMVIKVKIHQNLMNEWGGGSVQKLFDTVLITAFGVLHLAVRRHLDLLKAS